MVGICCGRRFSPSHSGAFLLLLPTTWKLGLLVLEKSGLCFGGCVAVAVGAVVVDGVSFVVFGMVPVFIGSLSGSSCWILFQGV